MAGYDEFRMFGDWDPEKKERALQALLNLADPAAIRNSHKVRTQRVPIQDYIEAAKKIREAAGTVQGLSTGIKSMDDMMLGMTGGELIIVSGPTSAGKTQLTTQIAYNVAKGGNKVLFVTMEMTKPQMTDRFMGASGTDLSELQHGVIEYQKVEALESVDISYLVADAVKDGSKLIVIDHLHYFNNDDENAAQSIGNIVKDFKQSAVANDVPIILISHIRKLSSDSKKPTGNDLRDSSLIGQHSDQIIMVWRDNSPDKQEDQARVEVSNWKNRLRGLHPGKRKRVFHAEGTRLIEGEPIITTIQSHPNQVSGAREIEDDDLLQEVESAFGGASKPPAN